MDVTTVGATSPVASLPVALRAEMRADLTRLVVWGRAAVLGVVVLGTGALSHLAGGGLLPGPVVLTLLLATCILLAAALLLRPASAARLVVLVVAGQTFVHTVLSATAGHRGEVRPTYAADPLATVPTAGGANIFDQYRPAMEATAASGGQDWLGHQLDHVTAQGPAMVLSHLAGAVALGLFLSVGETALWRLVALALARLQVSRAAGLRALAAVGVTVGVRLREALIVPEDAQVRGSQRHEGPYDHRRGPPYVLVA